MASLPNNKESQDARHSGVRLVCGRKVAAWALVALVWLFLDRVTKHVFDEHAPGTVVVPDVANLGIVKLNLVHNFGAAWGSFSGHVPVLAVFTGVLCLAILVVSVVWATHATGVELFALGILFAGGIGNLYDRIVQGYVTDFITPLFIDFPTFNVADIGVTVGIFLLCVCILRRTFASDSQSNPSSNLDERE